MAIPPPHVALRVRRWTIPLAAATAFVLLSGLILLFGTADAVVAVVVLGAVCIGLGGRYYETLLERRDEAIARHDLYESLTALPNRRYFRARLEGVLDEARRLGREVEVHYIDLDRFRSVVRTLGLAAGRTLLKEVAVRLQGCLAAGEFLARVGGDDFAVLRTEGGAPDEAEGLATRLLGALASPFVYLDHDLHLTGSIGIALFPHDGEDVETLLKNAYAAMNRAKEMGGNHFQFYFSDLSEYSTAALILENRLRKALNDEEFILLYQPQLDLAAGRVTAMEALVSWKHPAHPGLSPSEFIPLAEETGLIEPMGEWILRTACRQNHAWQAAGLTPLRVAVNVSARQFCRGNLVETVRLVLDETGLDPEWLSLEITETILLQDLDETVHTLHGLKDLGVGVTIDDFGVGYSSLNYLKRLPVQTLKIDRSFVDCLPDDAEDAAITAAVIAMAHAMGLRVVAEGVEREEQKGYLARKGCDLIQGYLLSRPLDAAGFAAFVERFRGG